MAIDTKNTHRWLTLCLVCLLAFVLCGGPELAAAQQPAQSTQSTPDQNAQSTDQQPQEQQSQSQTSVQQQQNTARPGMVDPSQGPLTPVPSSNEEQPATGPQNLPDAPSASQTQPAADQGQTTQPQKKPRSNQPVGVGTAQQAPTAGGAASKPAGAAIAPAKQKQYRSLLIKIGAIAGAGAALGTVYALSRGTRSTPPGAAR